MNDRIKSISYEDMQCMQSWHHQWDVNRSMADDWSIHCLNLVSTQQANNFEQYS